MAHKVILDIPSTRTVLHKDIEFEVHNSNGKLGTLLISKGNLEWMASPKSVNKRRLSWTQFSILMAEQGKLVRSSPKKTSEKKATKAAE